MMLEASGLAREIYAWVETHGDGREGIVAVSGQMAQVVFGDIARGWVPLVTTRRDVALNKMRPFAMVHRKQSGRPTLLVRWSERAVEVELP